MGEAAAEAEAVAEALGEGRAEEKGWLQAGSRPCSSRARASAPRGVIVAGKPLEALEALGFPPPRAAGPHLNLNLKFFMLPAAARAAAGSLRDTTACWQGGWH